MHTKTKGQAQVVNEKGHKLNAKIQVKAKVQAPKKDKAKVQKPNPTQTKIECNNKTSSKSSIYVRRYICIHVHLSVGWSVCLSVGLMYVYVGVFECVNVNMYMPVCLGVHGSCAY